jgi:hypothetical protein
MDYDAYDALLHHIFRQVRHKTSDFFRPFLSYLAFVADARRRMVQAVRREHPRRRLPSYSNRPIPRVPLREPLLGAVRGGSPCSEPRRRCQGTQRGCPRGVEHCVSQGVPGSLMELYCIIILNDAASLSGMTTRLPFMSTMTRVSKSLTACPIYRVLIRNSVVPSL